MVRWDSPLFTVPWTDEDVPGENIWMAATEGLVKPPNAGTTAVRQQQTRCTTQTDKLTGRCRPDRRTAYSRTDCNSHGVRHHLGAGVYGWDGGTNHTPPERRLNAQTRVASSECDAL
jgi:hypothetical protein